MLKHAQVDAMMIEAGIGVLNAAASANGERNRVVHDMWLQNAPDQAAPSAATWSAFRAERGSMSSLGSAQSRDLEYVQSVYTNLTNADLRVSGLNHALWDSLPRLRGSFGEASGQIDWLQVMNQRLTLNADGSFTSHHDSP